MSLIMQTNTVKEQLFAAVKNNNLVRVKQLLLDNPEFDVNEADEYSWTVLHHACYRGFVELTAYLLTYPQVVANMNSPGEEGWTALMYACHDGSDATVARLLRQPAIDVNVRSDRGATAFLIACSSGNIQCVRLLLEDRRTRVNERDNVNRTALCFAASSGHFDVIKYYLALTELPHDDRMHNRQSQRCAYLGDGDPGGNTDAFVHATSYGYVEVANLLKAYRADPAAVRRSLRLELGIVDKLTSDIYALIIFTCDALLEIQPCPTVSDNSSTCINTDINSCNSSSSTNQARRFFSIAKMLPMELQMILCYRVAESVKTNITFANSESAFRSLGRSLS